MGPASLAKGDFFATARMITPPKARSCTSFVSTPLRIGYGAVKTRCALACAARVRTYVQQVSLAGVTQTDMRSQNHCCFRKRDATALTLANRRRSGNKWISLTMALSRSQGAPYGYTPFCDNNKDMDGFRFWRQGFWKDHLRGKPYHISALYVVDLARFRRDARPDPSSQPNLTVTLQSPS